VNDEGGGEVVGDEEGLRGGRIVPAAGEKEFELILEDGEMDEEEYGERILPGSVYKGVVKEGTLSLLDLTLLREVGSVEIGKLNLDT
jgi:hypothetical protein